MSESELQLLLKVAAADGDPRFVDIRISHEEYRRLKAGIDQLAARESELAAAQRRVAELEEGIGKLHLLAKSHSFPGIDRDFVVAELAALLPPDRITHIPGKEDDDGEMH